MTDEWCASCSGRCRGSASSCAVAADALDGAAVSPQAAGVQYDTPTKKMRRLLCSELMSRATARSSTSSATSTASAGVGKSAYHRAGDTAAATCRTLRGHVRRLRRPQPVDLQLSTKWEKCYAGHRPALRSQVELVLNLNKEAPRGRRASVASTRRDRPLRLARAQTV
jgi:hypothetical protein